MAWVALALVTFIALFFIKAPYGKFTRKGFGPLISRTVGWVAMETPAFWLMILFFFAGDRRTNPAAVVFLAMWATHYFYRTYVFPFRMRGEKKRIALIPVLFGMIFNIGNGYLNGRYLFYLSEPYSSAWFGDPRFLAGAVLFAVGFGVNIHSDAILRSLRKPGETGYKIPRGGAFCYVSAANYFGEIIEWTGWAIATWSPAGLVFLIWTAANLAPRAWSQHKWYKDKFEDYPTDRKALIPFVF
jgi:3-oxo-5-alpha-steroid 4-dehydrogenase 1